MRRRLNLFLPLVVLLLIIQLSNKMAIADEWDDEDEITESSPVPTVETYKEFTEPKPLNIPVQPRLYLSDFYREIYITAAITIYILNFYVGKWVNEKLARKWMENHILLFRKNFAYVGSDTGCALIKDGPADFLFYLSGRRCCQYVHGRIKLKPRHDLIQSLTNFVMSRFSSRTVADTVSYYVTMNNDDFDSFIFAITDKEQGREIRKARYDLSTFTKQSNNNLLSTQNIHSESTEITDTILTGRTVELLNATAEYLTAVIISDQPRIRPEKFIETNPRILTVTCELPNDPSLYPETLLISKLLLHLIDLIPKCSFREVTKQKLEKSREEANKLLQKDLITERQEAIQQKKADKKRVEAERVAKLSPEEQRKYEEKERKRELKKKQKKMIKRI